MGSGSNAGRTAYGQWNSGTWDSESARLADQSFSLEVTVGSSALFSRFIRSFKAIACAKSLSCCDSSEVMSFLRFSALGLFQGAQVGD